METSSIDDDRFPVDHGIKEKTRKPADTAFRQQRLKAWQPILTLKTILPIFFVTGFFFAPIGGGFLSASAKIREISIDYTNCDKAGPEFTDIDDKYFSTYFKKSLGPDVKRPQWKVEKNQTSTLPFAPDYQETVCTLDFQLPETMKPPVLVFYRLTNFHQNHRRYVHSLSEDQLRGKALTLDQLKDSKNCDPLSGDDEKPYYPCGLIANSMFNDTFSNFTFTGTNTSEDEESLYPVYTKGIAWNTDKERYGKTQYRPDQIIPPPNWVESYPDGYNETSIPNLRENEAFQNWMRAAALPTFSKLAARNAKAEMKEGRYQVKIYYRFPVKEYSGTKSIVISTRTVMGGRNPFLGIAYIVVGSLCILLAVGLTAAHFIKPRKLGDPALLTWNKEEDTRAGFRVSKKYGDAASVHSSRSVHSASSARNRAQE